jgi:anti-sigma factor RsiW
MNCTEISDLLPEYIRRRLPADEVAAVRGHLSACPACAEAYEAELAFTQTIRGMDAPAPMHLLPQIMASVRVQPQHKPAFRLRPLDVVVALAAAFALYGMFIGVRALQYVTPFIVDTLNLRALFGNGLSTTLVLAAIFGAIGLAISIPVAAFVHRATTSQPRTPYISGPF